LDRSALHSQCEKEQCQGPVSLHLKHFDSKLSKFFRFRLGPISRHSPDLVFRVQQRVRQERSYDGAALAAGASKDRDEF
jgi:hypothetical protein